MKSTISYAFCAALGLSLIGASANAQTFNHWARKANPFTLQVIDSVTSTWDYALFTSVQQWSWSDLTDLKITSSDDSANTRQACNIVQGKLHVCNYSYGATGWLGLTSMGVDANGHIDRARVRLNDYYTSSWTVIGQRNHVACHEIGHGLGLKHTSEDGSSQATCMDLSHNVSSQWPGTPGLNTLASIYDGHLDSYDSYYGAPVTEATPPPTTTTSDTTSTNDKKKKKGGGDTVSSAIPTTSTCKGNGKKSCTSSAFAIDDDFKTKGRRIGHSKKEETWVSPREDGGMWIHHVQLP